MERGQITLSRTGLGVTGAEGIVVSPSEPGEAVVCGVGRLSEGPGTDGFLVRSGWVGRGFGGPDQAREVCHMPRGAWLRVG
jgi:hypothetical protein